MFKDRRNVSEMPEVNLVPMMDVLMTILTFFIIISMTLTGQQAGDIKLPKSESGVNRDLPPKPLIVALNGQKQTRVYGQVLNPDQLAEQMVAYLSSNPEGTVLLKADKSLSYDDVLTVLSVMRDVGGDRVSLAIE
ncbi:MAG: biopolymer transporter ExbD [Cyanobacteria bacterium]|nr:biopolymer transporter ExbD [Cyanobacteriota bacterium]MDW8200759.1 biopolymer transporter ExbD [Cyanobacteriota bacterium SKYGB_h_bin112]